MHFSILRKPYLLIPLAGLALAVPLSGDPQNRPAWWTDEGTRVIPPGAIENNKGPANIGQAKHMVAQALKALDTTGPTLATQIRADLAGTAPNFTNRILDLAAPANPAEQEKQKAPLLLGQLKAIAAPFYSRLAASSPANATWLAAERTTNDTNYPNSIFPWTATTDDDANKAIATIGQLKAVFSLRLESLPQLLGDSDGDGIPNSWETANLFNPNDAADALTDVDLDGFNNLQEYVLGTNPRSLDTLTDTDGDGMPDLYETANGLNISQDDSFEDSDGDRIPNIFEFKRGSLADDVASQPVMTLVVDAASGENSATDNVFSTIQEAIYEAGTYLYDEITYEVTYPQAYAIIVVKAGSYPESVSVSGVPVLLLGELGKPQGPPVIQGAWDYDAASLYISSASVIDGFIITHASGRKGLGVSVSSGSSGASDRRRLVNCVIRGNEDSYGGGIYNNGAALDLVHCTITGNNSSYSGNAIYNGYEGVLNLINSIVWGNNGDATEEIYNESEYPINAATSIIAAGEHGGVDLDPQLTPVGWLKSTSPAINRSGIIVAAASRVDIHGEIRPFGSAPDLGADEYKDANGTADGDGLPDWVEAIYPGLIATVDSDTDGLSNLAEYERSTNPILEDSDGDGALDNAEVTHAGGATNPLNPDSDGDGMWDGYEIQYGFNPLINQYATSDGDLDGFTNLQESQAETDPYDINDKPYQIVYSRPVSNETAVSRSKVLVFGLDRPLPSGITALPSFVFLESNGEAVAGTVQILSDRKTFAFISATPFAPKTKYRLVLRKSTTGVPLTLSSPVFITREEIETVEPFIMTTTPMDGNINVSSNIILSSYWSEPLDETALSANSVILADAAGVNVPCTMRYDPFWHRLDLIPSADLAVGSSYTVSLSTAIKNLRGQPLANTPAWSFTTLGEPLPIPAAGPYVTAITPGQLAENIATNISIEVVWSEAMNAATLNPANCKLTKAWNGEEIPTTLAYSSSPARLIFTPTAILAENTAYILRFADAAQSASGLAFSQHAEWQGYFRTGIEATDGGGVPVTPDPGWETPGPGGPGIGFPPVNP